MIREAVFSNKYFHVCVVMSLWKKKIMEHFSSKAKTSPNKPDRTDETLL